MDIKGNWCQSTSVVFGNIDLNLIEILLIFSVLKCKSNMNWMSFSTIDNKCMVSLKIAIHCDNKVIDCLIFKFKIDKSLKYAPYKKCKKLSSKKSRTQNYKAQTRTSRSTKFNYLSWRRIIQERREEGEGETKRDAVSFIIIEDRIFLTTVSLQSRLPNSCKDLWRHFLHQSTSNRNRHLQ